MDAQATTVWRDSAPSKDEICHLAQLAHLAYWWEGPDHHPLERLRRFSGKLQVPLSKRTAGEARDVNTGNEEDDSDMEEGSDTEDAEFAALAPKKGSLIKPFKDAYEVCNCLQSAFDATQLGSAANLRLWCRAQHGGVLCDPERGRIICFFRGTMDAQDLSNDVKLSPAPPPQPQSQMEICTEPRSGVLQRQAVQVHSGFLNHYLADNSPEALLGCIRQSLTEVAQARLCPGSHTNQMQSSEAESENTPSPAPIDILLTGHSLGSATATLLAFSLLTGGLAGWEDRVRVTLCTFASPRVGNAAFVHSFRNTAVPFRHMRVQNELDLVTRVPYWLPWPGTYQHVEGTHIWIRGGAVQWRRGHIAAASMPLNLAAYAVRGLWRDNKVDLRFHKMGGRAGYTRRLLCSTWQQDPLA